MLQTFEVKKLVVYTVLCRAVLKWFELMLLFISVKHSFPAFSKQWKTRCFAVAQGSKVF